MREEATPRRSAVGDRSRCAPRWPAVRLCSRRRIWVCTDVDCDARAWTEQSALAEPRRVLSTRAAEWACDRVAALE